jgi:adenylate kinase
MILEEIEEKGGEGFLLDGYPRTIAQADALGEALEDAGRRVSAVLFIDADDDVVVERLSGRRQCVKNGHLYHVAFDPPKHEGVCEQDGSRLIQREDDQPEKIRERLATFHDQTAPLVDYYEERGLLRRFDGTRAPAEVHDHIRATLATLRLEERL